MFCFYYLILRSSLQLCGSSDVLTIITAQSDSWFVLQSAEIIHKKIRKVAFIHFGLILHSVALNGFIEIFHKSSRINETFTENSPKHFCISGFQLIEAKCIQLFSSSLTRTSFVFLEISDYTTNRK